MRSSDWSSDVCSSDLSLQDYSTAWRSCTPVVALTVKTNTSELINATAFTLSWQQVNDTGTWEWRSTRVLYADDSRDHVQAVIVQELRTGRLEVRTEEGWGGEEGVRKGG